MQIRIVIALCVAIVAFTFSAAKGKIESSNVAAAEAVSIPKLPKSLEFAGEKVPLDYGYVREAIERELLTTSCMHTSTMLSLVRSTRYFPIIEPILEKYGVPNDFKYLCVAESSLNELAVSPARASGLWQFLSSAAKERGLEVNSTVDERYHIEKVTVAACKYLKSAKEKFGSWTLAAASYNVGRTGVIRRMEIQGVDDYWDLFLPEETMRYVPRILSFKVIMNDPAKYGFNLTKEQALYPFENYKIIKVDDALLDWSKIALKHKTNYRELRVLNQWIRDYEHKNLSRKVYELKVPTSKFTKAGY